MALTQFRDGVGAHRDAQMASPRGAQSSTGHPAGMPLVNAHAVLFAAASEGFRRAEQASRRSDVQSTFGRP